MAEDNIVSRAGGVTEMESPVTAPAPKKQRAPRQKRVAVHSVATQPEPAVTARAARDPGRKAKAAEAENTNGKSKGAIKNAVRKTAVKPVKQVAAAPAVEIDEIEDLVALEAENKRLRKILAEKLRQENAQLRKRLGLD